MKHYFIIVAGGSGSRMGASIPKQFLELNKKPILIHTLERVFACDNNAHIILALPTSEFDNWKHMCQKHQIDIPHELSEGGNNRFESVKNALKKVNEKSIVCIHDGVRPLIKKEIINRCIETAKKRGSAIPVVPIEESIREVMNIKNRAVNRDNYKIVQTPQCFDSELILKAYQQAYKPSFTDDASVLEAIGKDVFLVEGNKENIKITTPKDLILAESLIKQFD